MSTPSDSAAEVDRREALRLLLRNPLVTARGDPDGFALVRRHADELKRDFERFFGYRLVVEGRFARLHKAGLGARSGRRLTRATTGTHFSPRAYAYLVLALAATVTAPEQMLLSELVAEIRAAATEAGIDLGEPGGAQKRHLTAALRKLIDWDVLSETEGSVDALLADDEREALLTIDTEIARRIVSGPVGRARSPQELVAAAEQTDHGGPRTSVRRRIAETPVVYLDDLGDDERAWLRRNQRREQVNFHDMLGAELEIRAEGIALVREQDDFTDTEFPGTGTVAQAALLLIGRLLETARPDGAGHPAAGGRLVIGVPVPAARIDTLLSELAAEHSSAWSKAYVADIRALRADVCRLLCDMRLLAPVEPTRAEQAERAAHAAAEDAGAQDSAQSGADRQVTDVSAARGQRAESAAADDAGEHWVLLAAAARYRPHATKRPRTEPATEGDAP
ncbi:TIGR02678 family protein [Streptomonospora litoralis]|uniref:TIGR02678 family protein n=1 Tax=Streptomonospora litoralis TaxID=2498135 RepID=A0A4P6Q787_9ACTN|nr:TIGR02678 family protein [Streptomonospora litoralis]QBI56230.1 hypothetical protein EKD16_22385 [Streptomonospora litoralis]